MSYPVCGFRNYMLEMFFSVTGLVLPALFFIVIFCLYKSTLLNKTLASLLGAIVFPIVCGSMAFFVGMMPIEDWQEKEFHSSLVQLKTNGFGLEKHKQEILKSWAKCSNSDGHITKYEYHTYSDTVRKWKWEIQLNEKKNRLMMF